MSTQYEYPLPSLTVSSIRLPDDPMAASHYRFSPRDLHACKSASLRPRQSQTPIPSIGVVLCCVATASYGAEPESAAAQGVLTYTVQDASGEPVKHETPFDLSEFTRLEPGLPLPEKQAMLNAMDMLEVSNGADSIGVTAPPSNGFGYACSAWKADDELAHALYFSVYMDVPLSDIETLGKV